LRYHKRVRVALTLALLVTASVGCQGNGDKPLPEATPPANVTTGAAAPRAAEPAPQFIDVTFDFLHPIFLRHKIGQGPKAALWAERYHRRWVRWTGRIRSFSANGITLRQMPVTSTFDVSLWINNNEREAVRARYKVGDVVTYVGRLDSYDDIWRTLYLVNGSVLGLYENQDTPF
jgi:hypothetical protein